MKNLIAILSLFCTSIAFAEDNLCPKNAQKGYHPMPESTFTNENALKHINHLEQYFEGKLRADPEFVWQSQIVIEGAFLRNEIELSKGDDDYYKFSLQEFCKFMATKAYHVH